ncbi:MAG: hypothetical protein P8J18_06150 [Halieaceae bacterium]|nr:hypothetical protein [Halieaceae bacterium]
MTASEDQELLAFTNCELLDKGNNTTLIKNLSNNKELLVQHEVAVALTHLSNFKTLEQHSFDLINIFPQLKGDLKGTNTVLKSVRDAQMMVSADITVRNLQKESESRRAPLPSTRVFIITCDRPPALHRLLDSIHTAGQLERHDSIFVIDNSRHTKNSSENQKIVDTINHSSGEGIIYFGASLQDKLLNTLLDSMPEEEIGIRFLLDSQKWAFESSYGLSRNLCLLLSVGYRALILDDDILCEAIKPPLSSSGLIFGDGSNRKAIFYQSREQMQEVRVQTGFNPLIAHSKILGESTRRALSLLQHGSLNQSALNGSNAAFLCSISADSPILISQCGSWGDPGTYNPHWILNLDEASVAKIVESPGGLSGALSHRACWVGYDRACLSKNANISQLTGLDNSYLLPPYFPIYRGEDSLFGTMTTCLHPNSVVANLNWAVPHFPIEDRKERDAKSPIVGDPGLGLLSQHLSDNLELKTQANVDNNLKSISAYFLTYSEKSKSEIFDIFKSERSKRLYEALANLKVRLNSTNIKSRSWIKYLERGIEEIETGIKTVNLLNYEDSEINVLHHQKFASDFSSSLSAWKLIRHESKSFTSAIC